MGNEFRKLKRHRENGCYYYINKNLIPDQLMFRITQYSIDYELINELLDSLFLFKSEQYTFL